MHRKIRFLKLDYVAVLFIVIAFLSVTLCGLGVKISLPPEKGAEVLKKAGICFMFAQNYHLSKLLCIKVQQV